MSPETLSLSWCLGGGQGGDSGGANTLLSSPATRGKYVRRMLLQEKPGPWTNIYSYTHDLFEDGRQETHPIISHNDVW